MQQIILEDSRSIGLMQRMGLAIAFTRFEIVAVREIAGAFVHLMLRLDGKGSLDWRPGDKVQIAMGSVWRARTYTPFSVDKEHRTIELLAYTKAGGPGTKWATTAKAGDKGHLFGPRRSLPLEPKNKFTFIGDETSFAMAIALSNLNPTERMQLLFEVDSVDVARAALGCFNIDDVILFQRHDNDEHLPKLLEVIKKSEPVIPILTGRASTIQKLRKKTIAMKSGARPVSVAYWADGKEGLD